MTRLTDQLVNSGLPERTKLILAIAPGCLFRFPPPNLDAMIDRIDCPTCSEMMGHATDLATVDHHFQRRIDEYRRPTRERNEQHRRRHEERRSLPFIGKFFRPPVPEPDPDPSGEAWYVEMRRRMEELLTILNERRGRCSTHWGTEEASAISREVLTRFVGKDCAYAGSF